MITFDSYEWGIVDSLIKNHGYDRLKAITTMAIYIKPLRMLDRYENAEQKADILIGIIKKKVDAEEWVKHIEKMNEARLKICLSNYEKAIAKALATKYGYNENDAFDIVIEYIKIIRLIGGYDPADTLAEDIHASIEVGGSAKQWLENIEESEGFYDKAYELMIANGCGLEVDEYYERYENISDDNYDLACWARDRVPDLINEIHRLQQLVRKLVVENEELEELRHRIQGLEK